MEEYIDSIIRVGKILIGSIMVVFVLWYIVKDIVKLMGKIRMSRIKKVPWRYDHGTSLHYIIESYFIRSYTIPVPAGCP